MDIAGKNFVKFKIPKGCFPVMHFVYVRLRTYDQYAPMNEFTCSEHSVYVRKKNESLENSLKPL